MKRPLFIFLFFASLAFCQTNVYLRTSAAGGSFTITNCTATTPIVCATATPHGFSNGQVVAIYNVWGLWAANGLRIVQNTTSTTFSLTDINGVAVVGTGTFCDPTSASGPVCSQYINAAYTQLEHGVHPTVSALGTFTLKGHPRVWLDGPGGTLNTAITDTSSTGRANSNNVPWQAALNAASILETGNTYKTILNSTYPGGNSENVGFFLSTAFDWNALGGSTELSVARWLIDNPAQVAEGVFGCNPAATNNCNRINDIFYTPYYMGNLAQLYSLLHGQLSHTEITNFANAMLNGKTPATDGWDPNGCTNQWLGVGIGTVSTSGASTTVTISGGSTSQLTVGDFVETVSSGSLQQAIPVASIVDSTHFTTSIALSVPGGSTFEIQGPLTSTTCGLLWLFQFHNGSLFPDPINYPFQGGQGFFGESNTTLHFLKSMLEMSLALADDDPRAVDLLAMAYAYYYDNVLVFEKNMWTGLEQSRPDYGAGVEAAASEIAVSIMNSVNGYSPNLESGVYLQRGNAWNYYLTLPPSGNNPYCTTSPVICPVVWWGDLRDPVSGPTNNLDISSFAIGLYPNSTEAQYDNWFMHNQWGYWNATTGGLNADGAWHAGPVFVFVDPAYTQTDIGSAPHQYLFYDTDQASCPTYGLTCQAYKQYGSIVSRTGLKSANDTLAFLYAQDFYSDDHTNWGEIGELQIIKNVYLLGGDSSSNESEGGPSPGTTEIPEFGGSNATLRNPGIDYFDTQILRWAGADPTGDPNNNYTYALTDLTCQYRTVSINGCPASQDSGTQIPLTRAQKHFLHLKKPGYQDYIVTYDDYAASSGMEMRTYLHYALNYNGNCSVTPGEGVTFSGGSNGGTVTNNQTYGTLLTDIIAPAGSGTLYTYADNSNGTYTGGSGCTFRVSMCAGNGSCNTSATAMEAIAVHEPVSGSGGTIPAVTQLPALSFRVVQIADPSFARVAAFSEQGNTYTSVSYTSNYSGTGQNVIAGLTTGTYNVTVGGTAVSGSPFTVNAGDNTLYFESTSGTVSVSQTGSGTSITLSCDLNGDGVVNVLDVQLAAGAVLGTVPCASSYLLDGSASCDVIDVQRVANAALGLGCLIGQ